VQENKKNDDLFGDGGWKLKKVGGSSSRQEKRNRAWRHCSDARREGKEPGKPFCLSLLLASLKEGEKKGGTDEKTSGSG